MRTTRFAAAGALSLAAAFALTSCAASGAPESGDGAVPTSDGEGQTITV